MYMDSDAGCLSFEVGMNEGLVRGLTFAGESSLRLSLSLPANTNGCIDTKPEREISPVSVSVVVCIVDHASDTHGGTGYATIP